MFSVTYKLERRMGLEPTKENIHIGGVVRWPIPLTDALKNWAGYSIRTNEAQSAPDYKSGVIDHYTNPAFEMAQEIRLELICN